MHPTWQKVFFRRGGKPRGWTRAVLFRKDRTARPLFYRVVHKKNGAVRPHWAFWVAKGATREALPKAPPQVNPPRAQPQTEPISASEEALRLLRPFDQTVAAWRRDEPLPELMTTEAILDRVEAVALAGIMLVAGHDNYRVIPGGVQLCIQREEQAAISRGLAYLQFHPWQPLPSLAPEGGSDDLPVTMLLNGTAMGTASMAALTAAVARCVEAGHMVRLVIHHLLGHSPEALAALARAAQVPEVPFWLHDFFSLCPGYTLQRNGLVFCGAPDAESNACGLCVFGSGRPRHKARIADFFEAVPVLAVAPSQVTADFWSAKSDLPVRGLMTLPHVILDERLRESPERVDARAPITVGYLGATVAHKGWPVFAEMMNRHSGRGTRFVVFSDVRPAVGVDDWERVHVTTKTPDAMSQAVARAKVDVVLHWATWPETFSFTTFEALSAGAWVLTNPVSGNVQAAVRATGRGAVLDDEAALDRMFIDGSLARLVAERRATAARTELSARYSALSLDLPGWC
jgi:hypothetical protein